MKIIRVLACAFLHDDCNGCPYFRKVYDDRNFCYIGGRYILDFDIVGKFPYWCPLEGGEL